jgi:hypothetical protein
MILSISNKSTTQPSCWNYSTEMKSIARGVSTHISLLGSISETHQSHFWNYALLNTHTVATPVQAGASTNVSDRTIWINKLVLFHRLQLANPFFFSFFGIHACNSRSSFRMSVGGGFRIGSLSCSWILFRYIFVWLYDIDRLLLTD